MIDGKNHKTCIFGIQESGKTFFAKEYIKTFKKPIVFVINRDDGWEKLSKEAYIVQCENRLNPRKDFDIFITHCWKLAQEKKIDAIFIDEADLFVQGNHDINAYFQDLILNHRHIPEDSKDGVAIVLMTRRPQEIPTKIVESSKHLIIFKTEGANALQRFKEIHPDIPDKIRQLDYEKHNYVYKQVGKEPIICDPITPIKKKR